LQRHVGSAYHLLLAGFLLGSLFDPKDGGDMFLQSVGLFFNYLSILQMIQGFHVSIRIMVFWDMTL
jgi:hypothetical protein